MALIVEDGSVVAGANTYITDLEFTDYADARGYTYPATAPEREPLIIKANDYIQSVENKMKGRRTEPANQVLAYPRTFVYLHCVLLDSNTIPQELKNAQAEAAIAINTAELLITETKQNIASESVCDISTSYHPGGNFDIVRTETIDVYLDPLLLNNGGARMVRI